jgi:hypothetical protein
MSRNPYADAFANYPELHAPRVYQPARQYRKPTIIRREYSPEQDLNQTARVVVGGAVVIGTLGLLGGMLR